MDKNDLRAFALDERNRRRSLHRDYKLPADGPISLEVNVSAPVAATDPFIADVYRRAKDARPPLGTHPPSLCCLRRRFSLSSSKRLTMARRFKAL
jgi:hypothetical protein